MMMPFTEPAAAASEISKQNMLMACARPTGQAQEES